MIPEDMACPRCGCRVMAVDPLLEAQPYPQDHLLQDVKVTSLRFECSRCRHVWVRDVTP